MTNSHSSSDPDDRPIASLLKRIDHDAPLPDLAALDAIGVLAAAAFDDAGHASEMMSAADGTGALTRTAREEAESGGVTLTIVPGDDSSNSLKKNPRRHPMFTLLASRGLASLTAIVSTIALWFAMSFTSSPVSATPFSKVLSELQRADSMLLKIVRDGNSADVWIRSPGLVRYQESAQKYQIAAGSRLWKVDETTNSVEESDSPWFLSPQERIDLLSLLDSDITDASRLMTARPVEQTTRDGRDCLIYRTTLPAKSGQIDIEAAVDSKNLQLLEIAAWKPENKRKGPPLAEMTLVALNVAVADEQFAVSKSLSEDGRIGSIEDAQGIVVLRPRLAKRWTPVSRETILQPGDWVRTEVRGANAVKLSLTSGVVITLGPGSLVECLSQTEARLHYGMVQVVGASIEQASGGSDATVPKADDANASNRENKSTDRGVDTPRSPEGNAFKLLAPREGQREIKPGESLILRTDRDEKLIEVAQKPAWLLGFEGASSNESLGSLIVTMPDGRNEPLTVGYHKVTVEIRDQIARTTIEESFVNHTASRLEGIFNFPLPQDASISGFGMWIGNELVEADVVEKQRAREIYETILREKRDPGLLEWTSGNIFKARVFPIEARSEKRVKIVYTQVLPLRSNKYRYSYGLRSELLRTKPLRELSLSVTVNSALALKKVTCPTHAARIVTSENQTRRADAQPLALHSAQVEFSAQEYSPSRDFEVVFEVDGKQNDVVVIPHQRGDDGYFLIQLTPPGADGNWQREILPDGEPLKLVLLCDTSMSMDEAKRSDQTDFVASVLASLGPDDQFQLVAADVATAWASNAMQPATAANIDAAKTFLVDRVSLGWTILDRAFEDVLSKTPADAHVVYVGDGLISAGDTDAPAFVKRLAQRIQLASGGSDASGTRASNTDKANADRGVDTPRSPSSGLGETGLRRTLHAVTVGNTNDSVVMRGIATVGGGSSRVISGEQTAPVVATELLNEIAQPGLKDLKVEFKGVKVAAVYPEQLPNVAAGTQQILVGRYLPEGKDQQGEVIVTGKRGNETVRYAARIDLKNAEDGNSFIPRLWARSHLDFLLAQGTNPAIQDDVIRLSEEFHIITPYTSLLVLETDADRERFGVKRRFEMRDGERFFAQGRANANFELLQQQMKLAGSWRLNLRRQILRELAELGRNARTFEELPHDVTRLSGLSRGIEVERLRYLTPNASSNWYFGNAVTASGGLGGGLGGNLGFDGYARNDEFGMTLEEDKLSELGVGLDAKADRDAWDVTRGELVEERGAEPARLAKELSHPFVSFDSPADSFVGLRDSMDELDVPIAGRFIGGSPFALDKAKRSFNSYFGQPGYTSRGYYNQPDYTSWLNTLFPSLPAAEQEKPVTPDAEDRKSKWSPEAIAIADSLLRVEQLRAIDGGVEVRRDIEVPDPRWKRSTSRYGDLSLYSKAAWATRGVNLSEQTFVSFCDAKIRGVYSVAFGLGRVRPSNAKDLERPPLPLDDHSLSSLLDVYWNWKAAVERIDDKTSRLVLTGDITKDRLVFTIDTERHVILKSETFHGDKIQSAQTYDDFVQVAGTWWARHVQFFNADNKCVMDMVISIQQLSPDQFSERINAAQVEKASTQFLAATLPRIKTARQNVADGRATFEDRIVMILHNARLQQWNEMWKHVDEAEKLAADKAGIRWIRTILLATIRRHEEARLRLVDEAKKLATAVSHDEVFVAEFILGQLNNIASSQEFHDVHQLLKPVYQRPLADRIPQPTMHWANDAAAEQRSRDAMVIRIADNWIGREASSLERIGRPDQAIAVYKSIAESHPWDVSAQQNYTDRAQQIEGLDVAEAWLRKELARPERTDYDQSVLRPLVFNLLKSQAKWKELVQWTTDWISASPNDPQYNTAYGYHLAALILGDQVDAANELAAQWLREARIEGEISPPQRQRFDAAIDFLNGQVPGMNFQRFDESAYELLAESARFFATHKHHFELVNRCFSNYYFGQSDLVDQLRGEWLVDVRSNAATIPADRLSSFIGWTLSGRMSLADPINDRREMDATEVPDQVWNDIAATLKDRWLKAETKVEKQQVGDALVMIYGNRFQATQLLPFLRERVTRAATDMQFEPGDRSAYVAALFEQLLRTEWSADVEAEAFVVLRQMSAETDEQTRLISEIPLLMRLVDAMLANRIAAAEKQLHDKGETDKLTRQELAAKKTEIRETAHKELSQRLADLAAKADGPIADWFRMEHIWIDVKLGQKLDESEAECWKILGGAPTKMEEPSEDEDSIVDAPVDGANHPADPKEITRQLLQQQLQARAFATVLYLASRTKADPASVDRVRRYVDAGTSLGGESASIWRQTKFRLLVALDRPEDLESALRQWIRDDSSMTPWRQTLAQILAERGKLAEAVTLFEACEKDKLLTAQDYHSLANWYLALNRRADHERALLESYRLMSEQELAQILYATSNRWSQQGATLPSEITDETLLAIRILLEKSGLPENYFGYINTIYMSSRDFRMLKLIPDSMLGRTAQQAYTMLQTVQNQILHEIRNEATADELTARIRELRTRELTAVDRRSLDLLEAMIERRCAEVLNQPGPHLNACVAAMKRSFEHNWSEGEPQLMATFLRQLGGLPHEAMKNEQLRQIRSLHAKMEVASRSRLQISSDVSELLFHGYNDHANALTLLEVEIREYAQAHNGIWPQEDIDYLFRYVSLLEAAQQYSKAENLLQQFIAKPVHRQQATALGDRLRSIYVRAVDADASVSIGTGRADLFKSVFTLLKKELTIAANENQRFTLIVQMNDLLQTAHRHNIPGTKEAVQEFAFEIIPSVLPHLQENYREAVSYPLSLVRDVLGPKVQVRYLVERLEQYPKRYLFHSEQPFESLGHDLAAARREAADSELDDRILEIVLPQLRRYLTSHHNGAVTFFQIGYAEFLADKADAFAKLAEQILNERRDSGRRALRVAQYLHDGLGRAPRAIEILMIARSEGRTDENADYTLVRWLNEAKRMPESIEVLESLIKLRPDTMLYRTDLMIAYSSAPRPEQLKRLIEQTDAHFHANGLWTEGNVSQFAAGCLAVNEAAHAKSYMSEVIALHQRANPASGVNDDTLSHYYQQLASMESALGNDRAAVEAAMSSIICWSSQHTERTQAIELMKVIVRSAKNLDALVAQLDVEAKQSGQDNPILRKAIGQILQERSQHAKAIEQFKLALELQPNDREIHQALIACFDASGNPIAASVQLRKLIDLTPHDLPLYSQLADRLKDDPAQSERAATSIVESSPNEAEPHQAYAEHLQSLNRWSEAIPHWQQVARYRKLEPTGLLKLVEAQLHEKQFDEAKATLRTLQSTSWPARFSDVEGQIRNLSNQLPNKE